MRRAKGFYVPPKKTFIVHGEGNAQTTLKAKLEEIESSISVDIDTADAEIVVKIDNMEKILPHLTRIERFTTKA